MGPPARVPRIACAHRPRRCGVVVTGRLRSHPGPLPALRRFCAARPCQRALPRDRAPGPAFERAIDVTDEILHRAEELLGHVFNDKALLEESLTHSSAADTRLRSNERMEFLGDAVLDLVVCETLYRRFPEHFEGELTKVKSAVVSRKTCAVVARETGLDELLVVGKGIEGRRLIPSSLSAAVYESIIAALYIDGGFEVAR